MEVSVSLRHFDLQLSFGHYRAAFGTTFGSGRRDVLLRLPFIGEVFWCRGEGWNFDRWPEVK